MWKTVVEWVRAASIPRVECATRQMVKRRQDHSTKIVDEGEQEGRAVQAVFDEETSTTGSRKSEVMIIRSIFSSFL